MNGVDTMGSSTGFTVIDYVITEDFQEMYRNNPENHKFMKASRTLRANNTSGGLDNYLQSLSYYMRNIAGVR